ncbi:hypothetical protein AB0I66_21480 [Streptomyces sp. NPDC050439]|uniref:hypothetical protein n=1 Tax=unclassified Streptomyces TaxID=2593676 RepID=UPI00343FA7ED
MIVDLTDSITLIIIGACVTVGLIVSCGLLGIAALASAVVTATRRLVRHWSARSASAPNSAPHAATHGHTGTQSPARTTTAPTTPEAPR